VPSVIEGEIREPISLVRYALPFYSIALFLSALLLFTVQPMFTRMVLPMLGGSPAVWNTAVMFFQAMLLLGYGYAWALSRWRNLRGQGLLHLGLLALAFWFLPITVAAGWAPPIESVPTPWLVMLFAVSLGVPFFAVSATAPLLQNWFANTGHPQAKDPYFLYAASNLGGLLALLAYPVLIDPLLGLVAQSHFWASGYVMLAALIAGCLVFVWRYSRISELSDNKASTSSATRISGRQRIHWILLAFVPSALLLGVTLYLSTDIAAVPFMWVIPLALYILSFVLTFARRPPLAHHWMLELQMGVLIMLAIYFSSNNDWLLFGLHLLVLFVTSMVCHRELALSRPVTTHLTEFYLWMSLGGLLGSVFSVLVAPVIFDSILEYPLAIILACLLRPSPVSHTTRERWRDVLLPAMLLLFWLAPQSGIFPVRPGQLALLIFYALIAMALYSFRHRPLRLALGMAIFILGGHWMGNAGELLQERTFFGVYTVSENPEGKLRALIHGNTVHGLQATDPAYMRYPLGYYYRDGPLGRLFNRFNGQGGLHRIGVLGLGIGTIACYVRTGQQLTFYEIDPMVETIARNTRLFSYLDACGKTTDVVLGDGRLKLAGASDGQYDLLILDAFSSDAVPVHLLTREALQLYLRKISPDGILLFHVSNRYVQLVPVLARLAEDADLSARRQFYQPGEKQRGLGAYDSDWVIMARSDERLDQVGPGPRWESISATPDTRLWTDDYVDLFSALLWPELLW